MDELQQSRVKEALLRAQTAIQEALATIGAPTPTAHGDLLLPSGEAVCRHPKRILSMGGYWTCPDCGAEGREETV